MSQQRRAEIYLLCITIVWGSTFVVTKSILNDSSPLYYSSIRFLLAACILVVFTIPSLKSISWPTIKSGLVLGLLLYVGFVLQTIGLVYTSASKAAFFTGMLVPLTPVVQFISQHLFNAPRRQIRMGNIIGVVCAALGLYLLTSPDGSSFNLGDGLNLGSAVCFAGFIVYLDTVPREMNKTLLTLVQFAFCGLIGVPIAFLFEEVSITYTQDFVLGLLYLTIFATVITMWMQNRFQGETTPTRAAVIFAMEPVVAAVFAYYVRNEIIGVIGVVGGLIIVTGLLLSEFSDDIPFLKISISRQE